MGSVWPRALGYPYAIPGAPQWNAMIHVSAVSVPVIKSQRKGYSKCHSAEVQLRADFPITLMPP